MNRWLCIVALIGMTSFGSADEFARPYDAYQAGAEAAARRDIRHRQAIDLQLQTIDQMKWYAGIGAAGYDTYFRRPLPDLDSIYAYGSTALVTPSYSTRSFGYGPVFEPWPYVPGDIWGYPWIETVRQPIGRREIQTGPRRWESHPIYADPLRPPAPVAPVAPWPDPLPEVAPPSPDPPGPARSSVPRQF